MAITVVQSSVLNSLSYTLAYGSNNTAGNLLIAMQFAYVNTFTPPTDSAGNTWNYATGTGGGMYAQGLPIFYAMNCKAGANTVSFTNDSVGNEARGSIILEVSGIALTSAFDQGTTNYTSSASVTPTANGEFIIAFVDLLQTSPGPSITVDSGWTVGPESDSNFGSPISDTILVQAGYLTQAIAGSIGTSGWTLNRGSSFYGVSIASFFAASQSLVDPAGMSGLIW